MKAWKGFVGGRKEDNLFGLHEIVEVVSLIDGERGLGWVLEICFWTRSSGTVSAAAAWAVQRLRLPVIPRTRPSSAWNRSIRFSSESLNRIFARESFSATH